MTATITIELPLTFRRRAGRKQVVTPEGSPAWAPSPPRIDSTIVKAIARAHRWQALLEGGTYDSIAELAQAEHINPSYVSRVLRLTLLSPSLTEAILDGIAAHTLTLDRLMRPFPVGWDRQFAPSEPITCTPQVRILPPQPASPRYLPHALTPYRM